MSNAAFDLLARPIQQILWDMRWRELRAIQVEAIHEIIEGDHDLIISAQTASGKTEAAFLPILSSIFEHPSPSVQAVYIGPLKALINDQFRRLENLCQRAEIHVHRWHGDVDAGKKRRLTEQPSGVLLITPESIESLFINRSSSIARVFEYLQFVVIDEVHAFVGSERGTHLRSLLFRLQEEVGHDFRIVALSATLGDGIKEYDNWLRPSEVERVHHIHDPGDQKTILYRLNGYVASHSGDFVESKHPPANSKCEIETSATLISDMHRAFSGSTGLVFVDSRQGVEQYADALNEYCRQIGTQPEFLVHHGSLSKEIREHAEECMRGTRPHTTLCSSTLELGIDVGNVACVGQIGPPCSVNSLIQRIGRSGRAEGQSRVMRIFVTEHTVRANSAPEDRLYPNLLHSIANTELMLQKWVEPPQLDVCDLSTLAQQILSVLAQTGGIRADRLFGRLVTHGAFRAVERSCFVRILRSLATNRLIEQTPCDDLILAPQGERIVGHYSFYTAFATPIEYSVVHQSRPIGCLPSYSLPKEGDHLVLGARRWEVVRVDHDSREILVVPTRNRKLPWFGGGDREVHARTRQVMRKVLLGNNEISYLNETARLLLQQARDTAIRMGLSRNSLLPLSEGGCAWFTWTGTVIHRTLKLMADMGGLASEDGKGIAIHFKAPPRDVIEHYRRFLSSPPSAGELAATIREKRLRKYDEFLSEELLTESLARDAIDVAGACRLIECLQTSGNACPDVSRTNATRYPSVGVQRMQWTLKHKVASRCSPAKEDAEPVSRKCRQALSDVEFVAFDLETTGLDSASSEIVECAAIRFRLDGTELAWMQQLIDPGVRIPRRATRVHGITDAMVEGKPSIPQVLPTFIEFLAGPNTILLAHNAPFDIRFLKKAMDRLTVDFSGGPVIDTLRLSRSTLEELESHQLKHLADYFGFTERKAHRALADARLVMLIFVEIIQQSSGLQTVGDLLSTSRPYRIGK